MPVPERGGRRGASHAASPPSSAGNMAAAAQDELSKCSRRRDSQRGLAGGRATQGFPAACLLCGGARPGGDGSGAGPALGGHLGKRKPGAAAPPASPAPPRTRGRRDLAGSWWRLLARTGAWGRRDPRCKGSGLRPPLLNGSKQQRLCPSVLSPCVVRPPCLNHSGRVNTAQAGASRGGFPQHPEVLCRLVGTRAHRGRPCSARHMTGGAAAAEHSRRSALPSCHLQNPFSETLRKHTISSWSFGEAYGTSKKKSGFSSLAFPGLE